MEGAKPKILKKKVIGQPVAIKKMQFILCMRVPRGLTI
jgi:hypothetical protein